MFDVSVSFFVDKGEDVSLLNSRVLGRINPSDINKLYIECYKSVEVDGHPLKVHGSIITYVFDYKLKLNSNRSLLLQVVLQQRVQGYGFHGR